jgi:hypothetical protein
VAENLTPSLRAKFPKYPVRNSPGEKPGGWNPRARLDEMAVDGVSAKSLPTYGLRLLQLEDAELQEPAFDRQRLAIDYCNAAPRASSAFDDFDVQHPNAIKDRAL